MRAASRRGVGRCLRGRRRAALRLLLRLRLGAGRRSRGARGLHWGRLDGRRRLGAAGQLKDIANVNQVLVGQVVIRHQIGHGNPGGASDLGQRVASFHCVGAGSRRGRRRWGSGTAGELKLLTD